MKTFIFKAFIFFSIFYFGGTSHAQTAFDGRGGVDPGGSIIPGADTRTCDSSIAGAIRYNSVTGCAEYCDGASWICPQFTIGPADCPNPGDVCSDGTIFVGRAVSDTSQSLFIQTIESGDAIWSSENIDTGADSSIDGILNSDWVKSNRTISDYPVFELCDNLAANTHSDWYLPAENEFRVLSVYQEAIVPNLAYSPLDGSDWYYTSTEDGASNSNRYRFYGGSSGSSKADSQSVICFRRE